MPKVFDMSIFDPKRVWRQAVKAAADMLARANMQAVVVYLGGYANAKREWDEQRIKRAPAPPAKLAKLEQNENDYTMKVTYGPELVCEEKPAPWDIPQPVEPPNQVVVGVELLPGIFASSEGGRKTTVPVGAHTVHDGKRLTLIEQGKPGWLTYRKLWVADGSEV